MPTITEFISRGRHPNRAVGAAALQFLDWLDANQDSITAKRIIATASAHDMEAVLDSLKPFKLSEWLAPEDKATYRQDMPLIVMGAWALPGDDGKLFCEFSGARVMVADISIPRKLQENDFKPYEGRHPRSNHGNPLPPSMYGVFGLVKATESAMSETILIRLRPEEKELVESAAKEAGLSLSDYTRRRLLN